jgi:hypothetical protein
LKTYIIFDEKRLHKVEESEIQQKGDEGILLQDLIHTGIAQKPQTVQCSALVGCKLDF